jgi:hypothetical protein
MVSGALLLSIKYIMINGPKVCWIVQPLACAIVVWLLFVQVTTAQTISVSIPKPITLSGKYFFYLHGAVVTRLGNNAINQSAPEWGPYEYLNILDSLRARGFNVISEIRKEGVDDSIYVHKIAKQIDTLLQAGVESQSIIVVGASSGWNIGILVSGMVKNSHLNFVIMGGCWPNTYKEYQKVKLYGNFLSLIEASDPHGSCSKIFEKRTSINSFRQITLNTGMSHGFFYKGYKHWIDPVVNWFYLKK